MRETARERDIVILTDNDRQKLWERQRKYLKSRAKDPQFMRNHVGMAGILIGMIMFAKFRPAVNRAALITFALFALYNLAMRVVIRRWKRSRSPKRRPRLERLAVLLLTGYSALSLLIVSLTFLTWAIFALELTGEPSRFLQRFAVGLYALAAIIAIASRPWVVRWFINNSERIDNAAPHALILALSSSAVGAGLLVGRRLSRMPSGGLGFMYGLSLFLAILCLPVGLHPIYEMIFLARKETTSS